MMNFVTTALMVSALVSSISGTKMTEGQNNKGLYTPKRVSICFKCTKSDVVKLLSAYFATELY